MWQWTYQIKYNGFCARYRNVKADSAPLPRIGLNYAGVEKNHFTHFARKRKI